LISLIKFPNRFIIKRLIFQKNSFFGKNGPFLKIFEKIYHFYFPPKKEVKVMKRAKIIFSENIESLRPFRKKYLRKIKI